jgi:hypothetical protein
MPKTKPTAVLAAARAALAKPLRFEDFLAKLPPKERVNAERRVDAFAAEEQGAGRASMWQRLTCSLMTLAPVAKVVGKQSIQFFIPDGKYRMQVFALEDLQDGNLSVYCPDAVAEAVAAGLLAQHDGADDADPATYVTIGHGEPLHVDALDKHTINPAPHFKDLMGWNRKALRITLTPGATPGQLEATELLCAIAASHFAPSAAAAAPAAGMPRHS